MTVVGLLMAAGGGSRLGAGNPKAFVPCAGRPLYAWSLEALREVCDRVVIAVPPGLEDEGPGRVAGAAHRSESVQAALRAAPEAEVVAVHDAARPLLTVSLAERCLAGLEGGWDGAVAAARATDTVKEARPEDGRVLRTLARSRLWAVQTPQVFRAEVLRRALEVDEATLAGASDDAALVEAAGGAVRVVESPAHNLKVTTSLDLRIAEEMLRGRERGPVAASGPADRAGPRC